MKLKGGHQSVEQCRAKINQIISDRENELTGGFLPGGVGGGGAHYGPGRDAVAATNHLTIPDDKVGLVIGKGGGTIKGVQGRTGANIQIPGESDENDRSKRTIVISAGSQDAADRAMAEVQNILSADAASMGSSSGIPPGSQVLYVIIPDDKVRREWGRESAVRTSRLLGLVCWRLPYTCHMTYGHTTYEYQVPGIIFAY